MLNQESNKMVRTVYTNLLVPMSSAGFAMTGYTNNNMNTIKTNNAK